MDTLNNWAEQLESVPGYDMAMDWINEKAADKYQTKDPFYVEIHGKKKRRKAPETCTQDEQKAWKRIKKRAWLDDRNFFGCYPIDLGLGLAPLLSLLPVIGPLCMFAVHGRLVSVADQQLHLPAGLVAKMHANILFDLLISLPPILGSLFAWINACSTRNAALIHTHLVREEMKKEMAQQESQRRAQQQAQQRIQQQRAQQQHLQKPSTSDPFGSPTSTRNGSQFHSVQQPQRVYDPEERRGRQF